MNKKGESVIVALYLAAVVAANLTVAAFGPSVTVVNAFLLIGFDLTSRDYLQQRWEGANLWPRMAVLIGAGGALSYIMNANAAPIAIASTVSFVASGSLDAVVFALVGKRVGRMLRWNGTNLVGAGIDSLVFPTLAFGSILPAIVIGQYLAKVGGGFLWSVVLTRAVPLRRQAS